MNTLKLTTLTMLIPLGWTLSADAYPQLIDDADVAKELVQPPTCGTQSQDKFFPERAAINPDHFRRDPNEALRADNTTALHEAHNPPTDICWLDLDAIDIN